MKKFFYRVKEGDTLLSLARKFSVPFSLIIKKNNLHAEISVGDLLYIESPDCITYAVQPFDTAESVGKKFNVSPQKILLDNGVYYLFYGLIICIEWKINKR